MRFCICYHTDDEAAVTIIDQLKKINIDIPIHAFSDKEHIIFINNLDKKINEDFIIFVSKHQSSKHTKTLTIHSIGNFRKAEFGGINGKLSKASAQINKLLFQELWKQSEGSEYQCALEATHHGPYIEKHSCFIELGSTKEEWTDSKGGEIIAKTIQNFLNINIKPQVFIPAVGIGSGHYCPSFTKLQIQSKYAIAHILPKYQMPFTKEMIKEMLENTLEFPVQIIIDWKGIGKVNEREELLKILELMNLPYLKTDQI